MSRNDGKRPDGLTYTTWAEGKCLIWDFTCTDPGCVSYVRKSSKEACSAAAQREDKKIEKYQNFTDNYHFEPVGIETYGAFGPKGLKLLKKIGQRIHEATGEKRSTSYLLQNISIAIQRANAVCVMGTAPTSIGLEDLFDFVTHES